MFKIFLEFLGFVLIFAFFQSCENCGDRGTQNLRCIAQEMLDVEFFKNEQKTNGLALKMGIDPKNDILFVPDSWLKRYDWRREYLPDWIKVNPFIEQAYIGKGVKNDQLL